MKYLSAEIVKRDDEKRLVYGWASVALDIDGNEVVDSYGDVISPETLDKMANNFMAKYRHSKEMHKGKSIGTIVQSIVFTEEIQKALNVNTPLGWFIVVKVEDDEVWEKVKLGKYRAFSIGGWGKRMPREGK